jgi:hypothetical protein
MADGQRRTLDEVAQIVEQDERFYDQPPSRNTISNRMHDLAAAGELRRVERGVYELGVTNAAVGRAALAATAGTAELDQAGGTGEIRALRADRDVDRDLGADRPDEVIDSQQRVTRASR